MAKKVNRGDGIVGAIRQVAAFRLRPMTNKQAAKALGKTHAHMQKVASTLHGMGIIHACRVEWAGGAPSPVWRYGPGESVVMPNKREPSKRIDPHVAGLYRKTWALLQALERARKSGITSAEMARATGMAVAVCKRALEECVDVGLAYRAHITRRPVSDIVRYAPATPGEEPPEAVVKRSVSRESPERQRHERCMGRLSGIPTTVFDLAHHLPDRPTPPAVRAPVASVFALGDQYRDAA